MMRLLRRGLFGLWVLTGSWAAWAADARLPSVTRATDLSASVSITVASVVSKPDRNARVNDYSAVATVLNTSRLWIPRPFMLVVTMANRSAVLANATGVTAEGDPYIAVTGMLPLAGGRSMAIPLEILGKGDERPPSYKLRLVRFSDPLPAQIELMGVDADKNGIRDDLEPLLYRRYPQEPQLKGAAEQVLEAYRRIFSAYPSVEDTDKAVRSFARAGDCMAEVVGLDRSEVEGKYWESKYVNTESRVVVYMKSFNLMAGRSVRTGVPFPCVRD